METPELVSSQEGEAVKFSRQEAETIEQWRILNPRVISILQQKGWLVPGNPHSDIDTIVEVEGKKYGFKVEIGGNNGIGKLWFEEIQ